MAVGALPPFDCAALDGAVAGAMRLPTTNAIAKVKFPIPFIHLLL
jgi:hypothetical protein